MKLRNVLITIGFSFFLFSCNSVTQAYKETFGHQDKANENQEHLIDSSLTETEGDMHPLEESYLSDANESSVAASNLLENPQKLDEIQRQLRAMFPDKSLEIFPPHIYFEDDRIRLQLLDPNISGNIDWYYYQAETDRWEREDPVKTRANDSRKPVSLDTLKFSTANVVYRQLVEKAADIEGAETPSTVYFTFNVSPWNWNGTIRGSRSDYRFKANMDGQETEFKRQ